MDNYSNQQYIRLLNAILFESQLQYKELIDSKEKEELLELMRVLKQLVLLDLLRQNQ
jgi:hypothetical protein